MPGCGWALREELFAMHRFVLVIDHRLTEAERNALFDVGCEDATPEIGEERTILRFDRAAQMLADALITALAEVTAAGLRVVAVRAGEPVA